MPIIIYWHRESGIDQPTIFNHMLKLQNQGKSTTINVSIDNCKINTLLNQWVIQPKSDQMISFNIE